MKVKNIRIETIGNNHSIIIESEGNAMEVHDALVILRDFLPSLIGKIQKDSRLFVR